VIRRRPRIPMGNGLLGEHHQEMLALFANLDPRLKGIIMSNGVEILAVTGDVQTAVLVLLHLNDARCG